MHMQVVLIVLDLHFIIIMCGVKWINYILVFPETFPVVHYAPLRLYLYRQLFGPTLY